MRTYYLQGVWFAQTHSFQHPLIDFPPCCTKGETEVERGSMTCPKSNNRERRVRRQSHGGWVQGLTSWLPTLEAGLGCLMCLGSYPKSVPLLVACILRALQRSRLCGGGYRPSKGQTGPGVEGGLGEASWGRTHRPTQAPPATERGENRGPGLALPHRLQGPSRVLARTPPSHPLPTRAASLKCRPDQARSPLLPMALRVESGEKGLTHHHSE